MTTFRIDIVVQPSQAVDGIDVIDRRLQRVEKRAFSLTKLLRNIFLFVGIAQSIREVARLSDVFTNAQNRIRLVTISTAQLNAVTDELFKISARTRVSFEATSTLFARTALATRDLGLSQQETLNFTEALNRAIILSGASAQEANAAIIQLSQGLASGTLRGDELRSVLEQLPKVADVIAEKMEVVRGELRLLGEQGKISAAQIIDAFKDASLRLGIEFGTTIPTISQGFAVLTTAVIKYIAEVNEAEGISESFARALITISENLDTLGRSAVAVGIFLAVALVAKGLVPATVAVFKLTAAIALNPFGALAIGILAATSVLIAFKDEVNFTVKGAATLDDAFVVTWVNIQEGAALARTRIQELAKENPQIAAGLEAAFAPVKDLFNSLFGDIEASLGGLLVFTARVTDMLVSLFTGTGNAIDAVFSKLSSTISKKFNDIVNDMAKALPRVVVVAKAIGVVFSKLSTFLGEAFTDAFNRVVEDFNKVLAFFGKAQIAISDFFPNIGNELDTFFEDLGKIAGEAFETGASSSFEAAATGFLADVEAEAQRRLAAAKLAAANAEDPQLDLPGTRSDRVPLAVRDQIDFLNKEAAALKLTTLERDVQNDLLKLEGKLRTKNVNVTPEIQAELRALIQRNQALAAMADIMEEIKGPQQDLLERGEALNQLFLDPKSALSVADFTREIDRLAVAQAELNIDQNQGTFADGFIVGIDNMRESIKNFASEAGAAFGNFFESVSAGFADAIANTIIFGGSLREALGGAARSALQSLLSGLIELGVQYVINAALGESIKAASTASSVAQAAVTTTAWAPPAALVSLASFGANALPALAGIAAAVALAKSFADGGFVSGAGGSRSDSIPAMLSNGEFVINAASTARNRPLLESINNDRSTANPLGDRGTALNEVDSGAAANTGNTTVINVLDPSLVGDFLTSPSGERVLINVIERNANSISQLLGRN